MHVGSACCTSVRMHVGSACNMHVVSVRVTFMLVVHVTCMLYEC